MLVSHPLKCPKLPCQFDQQEEEDQEDDNSQFKMSKWEVMDKDEKMGKLTIRENDMYT